MTLRERARALLRVRLFSKIMIANAVLVALAATAGALTAAAGLAAGSETRALALAIPVVLAGLVLTVLIDAVLIEIALEPLHGLERAAERVRGGDLSARAPRSALADADLAGLVEAFNDALERVARYRRKLGQSAAREVRRGEEERDRVSRALHEDTAQRLAALLIRLRIAAGERQETEGLEGLLEETRDEIAAALDVIRGYAAALHPRVLEESGLRAALEARSRDLAERGLRVDVESQGDLPHDGELELCLYRIACEALDNARRHAGAGEASVRIARRDGATEMVIADSGRGFDVQAALASSALGLFEMRERAEAVGGTCVVESRPGGGTRVVVTLPGRETPRP
jgi:two-component system sensor histidine kinase UhpB